jgi:D-arabinose 1-dehydrogenase-like Zn-dependent alcohol dehydrogenase
MRGKIAFMPAAHILEFHEYEVPEPGPGWTLLDVTQSNVCGSEVHVWKGEFMAGRGMMPGHELAGRIAQLGEGVSKDSAGMPVKPGDRIAPVYFRVCYRCKNCVAGNQPACLNPPPGNPHPDHPPHFTAGFSTHYFIRPEQIFYRIPDNVPDDVAASANCAMSQVYWGLDRGRLGYDDTLVVQGAGGLGLHAMAIAKARGARVIAIDAVDVRLAHATAFGADAVIDIRQYPDARDRQRRVRELSGGELPDVVLEVAGIPQAFAEALSLVRAGGLVLELGNISRSLTVELPPSTLTMKSISVVAMTGYPPHYLKKSLDFLSRHINRYPYHELCDAKFPLSQAGEALDRSERREVTRAAVLPQQG